MGRSTASHVTTGLGETIKGYGAGGWQGLVTGLVNGIFKNIQADYGTQTKKRFQDLANVTQPQLGQGEVFPHLSGREYGV